MIDWHKRYVQQATWTKDLRTYLFSRTGLGTARRVLEVGCGTGAILSELETAAAIYGVDLQPGCLREVHLHCPQALLTCGDAQSLPFAEGFFEIALCHFLLLWVHDPLQALREMKRVTRSGGSILALAEPDYTCRVDKPDELALLGRWQTESLQRQGADPGLGKRLADLFRQADLQLIESGILRADRQPAPAPGDWELELAVLESDLEGWVTEDELQRLKNLDQRAWERGERVLNVPTYWAYGMVR
jgi:SAM-dependent methyltransferase